MLSVVEWLRKSWFGLYTGMWMAVAILMLTAGQKTGREIAQAEGDKAIADLRLQYADQRAQTAEDNLLQYRQQITRANQAEALLLGVQDELSATKQQLSERISHVTTVYRPARDAAPVSVPRAVFTCGWLRDYNAALGASVPVPAACSAAAGATETAWPRPGTDAELLESGVSSADILAHVQDYGVWAQSNLAQLNQLLDLHTKESR